MLLMNSIKIRGEVVTLLSHKYVNLCFLYNFVFEKLKNV